MAPSLYDTRLEEHRRLIEESMERFLLRTDEAVPPELNRAMRYACEAGGKRIRPVLTLEFCRLCGGDPQQALPFAWAIEMIHSYSLAHDDLPCMDNSPMRRGRPSAHAAFGESLALLAGDGLLTLAFEVMADAARKEMTPRSALEAVYVLARAAGDCGMVGGQVIDLQSEGKAISIGTLERLQEGKTAALLKAACVLGCLAADEHPDSARIRAADSFGEGIGLSFQIVDDILDVISTSEALGKPAGSDEENCKATYVSLMGLDQARWMARSRTDQAVEALSVFGKEADSLRLLAENLLTRQN